MTRDRFNPNFEIKHSISQSPIDQLSSFLKTPTRGSNHVIKTIKKLKQSRGLGFVIQHDEQERVSRAGINSERSPEQGHRPFSTRAAN